MARKTVVTGATGYVASQMLPTFRERYDLRLVDITRDGRGGRVVEDVIVHDLRAPDRYEDLVHAGRKEVVSPEDDAELKYGHLVRQHLSDAPGRHGNAAAGVAPSPGGSAAPS